MIFSSLLKLFEPTPRTYNHQRVFSKACRNCEHMYTYRYNDAVPGINEYAGYDRYTCPSCKEHFHLPKNIV